MYICNNKSVAKENSSLKFLASGVAKCGTEEWKCAKFLTHYTRLYFILDGDGFVKTDKGEVELLKNHCYLIPTGLNIEFGCKTKMEQLFFHLSLSNKYEYDLFRNCQEIFETPIDPIKLNSLLELYKKEDDLSLLKLKSDIQDIVLDFLIKNKVVLTSPVYSTAVQKTINYINERLSLEIKITDISKALFLSESTLYKKFKNEVGLSIGQYINEQIMQKAEGMLMSSDKSIAEISESFGFCDQFYFSRCFRKRFGKSPKEYRENL